MLSVTDRHPFIEVRFATKKVYCQLSTGIACTCQDTKFNVVFLEVFVCIIHVGQAVPINYAL